MTVVVFKSRRDHQVVSSGQIDPIQEFSSWFDGTNTLAPTTAAAQSLGRMLRQSAALMRAVGGASWHDHDQERLNLTAAMIELSANHIEGMDRNRLHRAALRAPELLHGLAAQIREIAALCRSLNLDLPAGLDQLARNPKAAPADFQPLI